MCLPRRVELRHFVTYGTNKSLAMSYSKTSATEINCLTMLTYSTLVFRTVASPEHVYGWGQGSSVKLTFLQHKRKSTSELYWRFELREIHTSPTFAWKVNEFFVSKRDYSSLLFFHCSCRHPSDSLYPGYWRCLYVLYISGETHLYVG